MRSAVQCTCVPRHAGVRACVRACVHVCVSASGGCVCGHVQGWQSWDTYVHGDTRQLAARQPCAGQQKWHAITSTPMNIT